MAESKRPWPEAADSARLQRVNPGIFYALASVKHFVYDGDEQEMTQETLTTHATKHRIRKFRVVAGIRVLIEDAVLVDKSGDGILKLDLSKLEDQIEIYNETP